MRRRTSAPLVEVLAAVVCAALLAWMTGCSTIDWKGRSIDEVVKKMGNPSSVQELPDGRRVFTWVSHRSVPVAPVYGPRGEVLRSPGSLDWVSRRVFVVDPDGVVLQVREVQPPPPVPRPVPGYPGS